MNLKVASCCVCYLFWTFFIPQTQTEFRHDEDIDHDWVYVKNVAIWSTRLLEENKELIRSAPMTYKFIKGLATNVKSFVGTVNPAYAAATVYLTGVLAVSYHYSIEAHQQLLKAELKNDDLRLIIDTEIIPTLELLERLHSKGNMESFCKANNAIQKLFANGLTSLNTIKKDVDQQIIDVESGTQKNTIAQLVTAGVGIVSIGVIATAPCLATAFFACPQALAGSSTLVSSVVGFGFGYTNKMTHEETMAILRATRQKAHEVEKVFRMARTDAEIICEYQSFPGKQLKLLESVSLPIKPTTDRLQLDHGEPN